MQQISDVLDPDLRKKLMYDDHKLNRSEIYFTVVQLLRIFEEWTAEPEDTIRTLRYHTIYELKSRMNPSQPDAQHIIETNWISLLTQAQTSKNKILGLIKRKRDEIESLRDGVRSAT